MGAKVDFHEPDDALCNQIVQHFVRLVVANDYATDESRGGFASIVVEVWPQQGRIPPPQGRHYINQHFNEIEYDYYDGHVGFAVERGANVEATMQPLVDVVVQVFLERQIAPIIFGSRGMPSPELLGISPIPNVPCSPQTLHRLFTSNHSDSNIIVAFGWVRIQEDLIQAFSRTQEEAHRKLCLEFLSSVIDNHQLLGERLRHLHGLTSLRLDSLPNQDFAPLLQGLQGHPSLRTLSLFEVCGQSLTSQEQSQQVWDAIRGMPLQSFLVEQDNDDPIRPYAFDGLWAMVSGHASISNVRCDHHKPLWNTQRVATVANTLRKNEEIVCIETTITRAEDDNAERLWNETVRPLLKKNNRRIQIKALLDLTDFREKERQWLARLQAETKAVDGLYQVLRGTLSMWVPKSGDAH